MTKTVHTTYDVRRQTTVVATHRKGAATKTAKAPPAARPGISRKDLRFEIIGDGPLVLVDAMMPLHMAKAIEAMLLA